MPQFQLLPGAFGVDFPSGRHVRADHRGRITVTDEQAAAMRGSSAAHRYDAMVELAPGRFAPSKDDPTCPTCGRTPWPWQTACGRCGTTLKEA